MADDKGKTDQRDRSKVASGQDYEIEYLTRQIGITPDQARQLIKAYGNDREKLMRAAKGLAGTKPNVRSSRV
jgi:glycerol-3-phosphate dehydrogenase